MTLRLRRPVHDPREKPPLEYPRPRRLRPLKRGRKDALGSKARTSASRTRAVTFVGREGDQLVFTTFANGTRNVFLD
jgi:hypothetical protein